jgi:hypothetical protein
MTHPEKPGRSVEEIIGTTIYQDCSQKQRDELARYITENPEGVHETARKVALEEASGRIDAAVPILLARLRNGQHRKRELQTIRGETDLVTFAECRYQAKMTSLAKHRTNPDEWNRTEALEYAVDWTADSIESIARRRGHTTQTLDDPKTSDRVIIVRIHEAQP